MAPTQHSTPITISREQALIRLLRAFLVTGLFFMLFPGTFLGVWNLFTISFAHSATSAPESWIQAHGHAQLFGWIGSFILGIGFYSTPNLRRISPLSFWDGWLAWLLWTIGLALRWSAGFYLWQWRILFPLSASLELLAVGIFARRSIQGHMRQENQTKKLEPWSVLVVGGTVGFVLSVLYNCVASFYLSANGQNAFFPAAIDKPYLVLSVWGFVVPIVWGFTTHWMPIFLGLKKTHNYLLLFGFAVNTLGVILAFTGQQLLSFVALLTAGVYVIIALRLFERPDRPAKTAGVDQSFPLFVRVAYLWLLIANLLSVCGADMHSPVGIMGAARHAITVGFLSTMVLCVAPRMLPAFLGKKQLFSTALMLVSLIALTVGCFLRVFSQVIAYQDYAAWAWTVLPVSATLELIALTLFSVNMIGTFLQPPSMPPPPLIQS